MHKIIIALFCFTAIANAAVIIDATQTCSIDNAPDPATTVTMGIGDCVAASQYGAARSSISASGSFVGASGMQASVYIFGDGTGGTVSAQCGPYPGCGARSIVGDATVGFTFAADGPTRMGILSYTGDCFLSPPFGFAFHIGPFVNGTNVGCNPYGTLTVQLMIGGGMVDTLQIGGHLQASRDDMVGIISSINATLFEADGSTLVPITSSNAALIPEPSSTLLAAAGLLSILGYRTCRISAVKSLAATTPPLPFNHRLDTV